MVRSKLPYATAKKRMGVTITIAVIGFVLLICTPNFAADLKKLNKVTLNLIINGKGTVWIDDIVLSKEPLK